MTQSDARLFRFEDLAIPVIQAPMAGTATPELAAEVSRAGGLGSLGLGSVNADKAAQMMAETQQRLGSNRYGVNLFCHRPGQHDLKREQDWLDYLTPEFSRFDAKVPTSLHQIYRSFLDDDAMLTAVVAARPAVVSFHFRLPRRDQIAALRGCGAYLMATATSLDEAVAVREAGLDAIVVQGFEAGGHRGVFDPDGPDDQLPLDVLLAQLKGIGLPVVAAGGVMDGHDAVSKFRLGAVAVQMGTAFVACPESAAGPEYRARLGVVPTVMTTAISGRPARGMQNRLTQVGSSEQCPVLPDYPMVYDATKALSAAAGGSDYAAHWAGTEAHRSRAVPAAELMSLLAAEIALISRPADGLGSD